MKRILNLLIIPFLLIISYETLTHSKEIINCVNFSFGIWKNNVFPSLFPFFIISSLLINYGLTEILGELLKPIMSLFKINNKCSIIFVMSMLSGFPSSALYAKKLYNDGLIDEYDASKVLTFSHFSNPLFILGTLSLFLNKKISILILIIHYLTNIIIGLIFRFYHKSSTNNKIDIKKGLSNMMNVINQSKNIGIVLTNSIKTSISTLLTILGTISFFLIITTIINCNFNLNNISQSILNGLLEMTQGLKYISLLDISLKLKATLSIFLLSFGGLSIHMQIISIISETKIKYFPFFVARVMHAIISSLLLFTIYDIFI